MAIPVFVQNLPFRHKKPTAEPAFCPHFQVVKVGENAINGDTENRNMQECDMEGSLRVVPVSVKGAQIMSWHLRRIDKLHTCKSDYWKEGGNDIEVTKSMKLREWLNGRGRRISLSRNRSRDRRRTHTPLTS